MLKKLKLFSGASTTRKLNVLAIDDDAAVLNLVNAALRRTSWKVTTLSDLTKGIELDRAALPDVILSDASMPGVTGPQLIAMLKADPATEKIPVVLMSGYADADMFSHVPWTAFLAKPFNPKELIEAIESAVTDPQRAHN